MHKRYYKDLEGRRIWYNGCITKDGKNIYTWDEELILADGWTEHVPEPVPPYVPTREEKINAEIRARYTENDEFQVLRQYSAIPDNPAFKAAFDEYNAFVEEILSRYPEEN